jgi:hypothetical protein
VRRIRDRRSGRVGIGRPDGSLTGVAGLVAVEDLDAKLKVTATLDGMIGPIKRRDRGLSAGELLMAVASCQLAGGDHLVSLDRLRADAAGQELVSVPTPPPSTAAGLARRFGPAQLAGIQTAIGANQRPTSTPSRASGRIWTPPCWPIWLPLSQRPRQQL